MDYKKNLRHYDKVDSISFRSTKDKFGSLSNMAGGFPIRVGSYTVRTSEALYQALKFPNRIEIQEKIVSMRSPIFAKRISRKHQNETRQDWDKIRFKVMKLCIELKLIQNYYKFSTVLISTKDKNIVEYSNKDKIWGASSENDQFIGVNAQGRLLMEIREKVKKYSQQDYQIDLPKLQNLYFYDIDLIKFVDTNYKTAH